MDDALFVLCYSWLSMDGKLLYNDEKDNIIPEVNDRAKKSRKEILKKMGKKRMTKKLKERKARVCEKLIFKKEKHYLWLISSTAFYRCSSLHIDILAKRVSRLHLEIFESTRDFFSCFLKHEPVKELTCSIKNELPKTKDIYIGSSTGKILVSFVVKRNMR